jgi:hypothetical protein
MRQSCMPDDGDRPDEATTCRASFAAGELTSGL